jgi:hypothetical protein
VWESWQIRSTANGYEVADYSITEPPFNRAEALATIAEYFGHIANGEWTAAAALLDDGARAPDERPDLQQLAPADYTNDGIGAALQAWCANGCDTVAPTADELRFTGAISLTRSNEKITVAWYEGRYSIVGLPFRTNSQP